MDSEVDNNQPTVSLFTVVNHCSGPLRKQTHLAQWGTKGHVRALWLADFNPLCQFLYFCSQTVVTIIMIGSSKTHKLKGWVQKQPMSYFRPFVDFSQICQKFCMWTAIRLKNIVQYFNLLIGVSYSRNNVCKRTVFPKLELRRCNVVICKPLSRNK